MCAALTRLRERRSLYDWSWRTGPSGQSPVHHTPRFFYRPVTLLQDAYAIYPHPRLVTSLAGHCIYSLKAHGFNTFALTGTRENELLGYSDGDRASNLETLCNTGAVRCLIATLQVTCSKTQSLSRRCPSESLPPLLSVRLLLFVYSCPLADSARRRGGMASHRAHGRRSTYCAHSAGSRCD